MKRKLLLAASYFFVFGILRTWAQAPVTDFSASPTAGCGPLTVQFRDLSSNSPQLWNWDFGDGQGTNIQNPTHTYYTPGVYDVTLTTVNRSGSNPPLVKRGFITIYPYPQAKFTSNLTVACSPSTVQFTDQSTPGAGTIASWSWDFGDGSTGSGANPTHQFTQPGYYDITLKVTNSQGCSLTSNIVRYLRIIDGIQPNFTWDQISTTCSAPFTLNFLNQTAGPGNLTFNWNLGNGANPAASSDTNPKNIVYPATGNYNVTLQVQSSLGCSATLQQTVPLNNNAALINGPDTVCVNTPATFTDASTPPPASATWDFG
ncbi:MAG: PKD domain-containing protein, partial [Bacteroidetes bacterium]|nr:PKD domain-containing protein [Bacteroidota bacterium]